MVVSEEGFREDGRRPGELRRIEVSRKMVGEDGRVDLRQGTTQVTVVCRAARDASKPTISVEFYSASRQEPVNEKRAVEYEGLLSDIFGDILPPETSMDISVVVREDGGSLLSAMINCTSLCLAYFGVSMVDMCYSTTVTEGCIDLSSTEESQKASVITIACLMSGKSVFYLSLSGRMPCSKFQDSVSEGMDACYALGEQFKGFFSVYQQ